MNQLHPIAQAVQSQGRGRDTQLIHMTPGEVQGLQALAVAHGGSLSINPTTGLPEAGFLESILPTVAGFALNAMVPGLGTLGSAALVGLGTTALNGGDLGKGLMAGLGAWGGAGLSESLLGQASKAAAANVASSTPSQLASGVTNPAAQMARAPGLERNLFDLGRAPSMVEPSQLAQGVTNPIAPMTKMPSLDQNMFDLGRANVQYNLPSVPAPTTTTEALSSGFKSAMESPGEFLKDNWKYAGAAAAPMAMDMMTPKGTAVPTDNEQYQYTYLPGRASEADLAAQRAANPQGELTYFRPRYQGPRRVNVAQGGELKYADGGIFGMASDLYGDVTGGTQEYEYDPVTRTYKKKASAPIGAVTPVGIAGGDSGGSSVNPNDNYYSRREAQLRAANMPEDKVQETLRSEQVANNEKLGGLLGLLAPGSIARALVGGLNTVTGGATGQTAAPVFKVDTSGTGVTSSGASASDNMGGSVTQYSEDPAQTAANQAEAEAGGYPTLAQGGALHYENGGPTGAVEPVGINNARPTDAGDFKAMATNAIINAGVKKGLTALGAPKALAALGPVALGLYGMYKAANPDPSPAPVVSGSSFPSVPGQNPGGDSGPTVTPDPTGATETYGDTSMGTLFAQGGLAGLSAGGMAKGGFVVPADVVSALGNGSTDAGLRTLQAKIGAVKPIKGKGDGLSDSIPTSIDGKQPARVADGEAYIPPETVAKIGGGNPKKGAKKLYAMMDKIRQQAHGKKTQQRKVNAKAVV